jgi:serine/threonine-protein phosphatase 2A activator
MDSYGSNVRLDYGTGHEMAFVLFLLCLRELGFYSKEEYESLARDVFYK